MTRLTLPTPPDGIQAMQMDRSVGVLAGWLMTVARARGEPALDFALGAGGWPGTPQQRDAMPDGHIVAARNEARQLASETWAKEARERGEWGV